MTWRMLDLFSGIGGFSLAAQWVWGDELEIVAFCEIDKFCQKVLHKHWPNVPISVAGKRKGKEDNRFLWPEMFRVIKEIRPRWIVAENVTGIVRMVLDDCLSDLEGEGYSTQPIIIPACAVNAPHRRDRVWITAYSLENALSGRMRRGSDGDSRRGERTLQIKRSGQDVADTEERTERAGLCQADQRRVGGRRFGNRRGKDGAVSECQPRRHSQRRRGEVLWQIQTERNLYGWWNVEPKVVYQIFKAIKEWEGEINETN